MAGHSFVRMSDKQKDKFCQHYVEYFDPQAAYKHIKPKSTQGTAYTLGLELLKNVYVKNKIKELQDAESGAPTKEYFCSKTLKKALANRVILLECETLEEIKKLPIHIQQLVKGSKYDKEGRMILYLEDQTKLLELYAKLRGFLNNEEEGIDLFPDAVIERIENVTNINVQSDRRDTQVQK